MAKIIEFKTPGTESYELIQKGEAICHNCGHEWSTGHPVGKVEFPCPKCGRTLATFKYGVCDDTHWKCNCGCYLFTISTDKLLCWKCGLPVNFGD